MKDAKPNSIVVLASTFPRWPHDTVPDFVLQFVLHLAPRFKPIVIAPHYKGAKRREIMDGTIRVRRFRYAYPDRFENVAYGQFQKTAFYPIKMFLYITSELWMTLRVCLCRRPRIINAHWLIPQGFVAVLVAPVVGAKVVVSVHGADVFTLNGKFMRKVKRFILKHADAVVVNSSETQTRCGALYAGRKYPVIPMGINAQEFARGEVSRKPSVYTVLFVGRLAPSKGIIYLCEAVVQLRREHANIRLRIVGDGPERTAIEQFVQEHHLGSVIELTGWVQPSELPAEYQAADVFVGPSVEDVDGRREAFGLVFAEAAASGLPVVTTDAGGMRDIVKHKETGLIVPQKDAAALVTAIRYLYEHQEEATAMGRRGQAFVGKHFSWDHIARQYRDLFADLLR